MERLPPTGVNLTAFSVRFTSITRIFSGSPGGRGRFGAIDSIQGNLIRIRDPRSGKTWNVRTRQDTVIEFGRHRRIPFDNLRVGQRIFVTGMPDESNAANEFDADFIGVVLGQPQRFVRPAMEPMWCWECAD